MVEYMLTTVDNPFDPFTQYDEWLAFDTSHGYHTNQYLARIVRTSDELSEPDRALAIDWAMDEIVQLNVRGVYMKITADEGRSLRETNSSPIRHGGDRLVHISQAIDEFVSGFVADDSVSNEDGEEKQLNS